ncbi:Uncharacterised protein [Shigella sonnei]|nr:Uncharacterised protein [Shigella sonnei]
MSNNFCQRSKQHTANAVPRHQQNQYHHQRDNRQLPLGKSVIICVVSDDIAIQFFTAEGVLSKRFAHCILHSLGWLSEISSSIAII